MTEQKQKSNKGLWILLLYIIIVIGVIYYYQHINDTSTVQTLNKPQYHNDVLKELNDTSNHTAYISVGNKSYKLISNNKQTTKIEITRSEYEKSTN